MLYFSDHVGSFSSNFFHLQRHELQRIFLEVGVQTRLPNLAFGHSGYFQLLCFNLDFFIWGFLQTPQTNAQVFFTLFFIQAMLKDIVSTMKVQKSALTYTSLTHWQSWRRTELKTSPWRISITRSSFYRFVFLQLSTTMMQLQMRSFNKPLSTRFQIKGNCFWNLNATLNMP